ncbi:hypothetical protein T492DRAFT_848974 [Pavlovales sp. CCMP2436]|nr:hypothetical protein T492DRAFT_848974 [Pavlovales sp. CCMP2436]
MAALTAGGGCAAANGWGGGAGSGGGAGAVPREGGVQGGVQGSMLPPKAPLGVGLGVRRAEMVSLLAGTATTLSFNALRAAPTTPSSTPSSTPAQPHAQHSGPVDGSQSAPGAPPPLAALFGAGDALTEGTPGGGLLSPGGGWAGGLVSPGATPRTAAAKHAAASRLAPFIAQRALREAAWRGKVWVRTAALSVQRCERRPLYGRRLREAVAVPVVSELLAAMAEYAVFSITRHSYALADGPALSALAGGSLSGGAQAMGAAPVLGAGFAWAPALQREWKRRLELQLLAGGPLFRGIIELAPEPPPAIELLPDARAHALQEEEVEEASGAAAPAAPLGAPAAVPTGSGGAVPDFAPFVPPVLDVPLRRTVPERSRLSLGLVAGYRRRLGAVGHMVRNYTAITRLASARPAKLAASRTLPGQAGEEARRDALATAAAAGQCSAALRPLQMRQQIFFPDKRLMQWDCGKLQMLDGMLRGLHAGGHRCLIFTQYLVFEPSSYQSYLEAMGYLFSKNSVFE